jgi:hypothetical protein
MAVASLEAAVDTLIIISNDRLLKGTLRAQQHHMRRLHACPAAQFKHPSLRLSTTKLAPFTSGISGVLAA